MTLTIAYGHGGDAGLGEQSLGIFEFAIALVRLRVGRLVRCEVAFPAAYYVAAQLCILKVGALKGIDLSFQICQLLLQQLHHSLIMYLRIVYLFCLLPKSLPSS